MKIVIRKKEGYGEELITEVSEYLRESGHEVTLRIEDNCDLALIIGGDGTLLRDHSLIKCPVMGINPGSSVGHYITAFPTDWKEKLGMVLSGEGFRILKLTRLQVSLNGRALPNLALNEVLINPIFVRRLFESNVTVNGKTTLERNSGIIVYTPTGSSAFANSAGAEIMNHDSKYFGAVAIAPYKGRLKSSEILIKDGPIEIECVTQRGEVSVDGSERECHFIRKGDVISIAKSERPLELIWFGQRFRY